jgi:hypothetical protein
MNINRIFEILKISLQTTVISAVNVIIVGGTHAYAEHSCIFWIVFFSTIFIFSYPIGWILAHYIVLPIMKRYE